MANFEDYRITAIFSEYFFREKGIIETKELLNKFFTLVRLSKASYYNTIAMCEATGIITRNSKTTFYFNPEKFVEFIRAVKKSNPRMIDEIKRAGDLQGANENEAVLWADGLNAL